MKQRPRIYYTETDKALTWDRWQEGDSLQTIAQLFGRNHSSIKGSCRELVASDRLSAFAHQQRSHSQSVKKSHEGLLRDNNVELLQQ